MNKQCQIHPDVPLKFVPPGISKKTGKPYQGFDACSVSRCNGPIVTAQHPIGTMNSPKREPEYVPDLEDATPHTAKNGNTDNIWEAKDRLHAGQTAINAVATLHEGSGKSVDELKPEADKIYKWLLGKKKNGDDLEIEQQ